MGGESRKWMMLVAAMWIQALTGTNFDFSSYSSTLKSVLGISQVQLNYLSVASDMGKAFGWCAGVCLIYLPLWLVMFIAAFLGLVGYGFQWLIIRQLLSLPYFLVLLLCLVSGCSICWFNTVCLVVCIRNFASNRALALSLTISFNGLTGALFTLISNAINSSDDTLYLFLNATIPLFISGVALIPILRQPTTPTPTPTPQCDDDDDDDEAILIMMKKRDSQIFLCLNIIAVLIGVYLLLLNPLSYKLVSRARLLLAGAALLLILPLCFPAGILCAQTTSIFTTSSSRFNFSWSSFCLIDLHKQLLIRNQTEEEEDNYNGVVSLRQHYYNLISNNVEAAAAGCCALMDKDLVTLVGEEHPARLLVRRFDFWLYYLAYFCGATIGLVYSNNLGQICQSLGYSNLTSSIVTLYSTCSFFGRLLSSVPDFMRHKVYFARTGWLALALLPTPIAFFLLSSVENEAALRVGTILIGLSSGFIFSAAVSITAELFGPNSAGVNHNILITNIPIGSLLYGILAALVYDSNADQTSSSYISKESSFLGETTICTGRKCYFQTFIWWGCIATVGLTCSFLLFLRTKPAYDRFERNRNRIMEPLI